jgi:hypothetical protein
MTGWNLPPGCNVRDLPGAVDQPCAVCAQDPADCICPECPVCGATGDPGCYAPDAGEPPLRHRWVGPDGDHGLTRSLGQVLLAAEVEAVVAAEVEAEAKYEERLAADERYADSVEITPEMEAAGVAALIESGRTITDYEVSSDSLLVRRIFYEMWDRRHKTR